MKKILVVFFLLYSVYAFSENIQEGDNSCESKYPKVTKTISLNNEPQGEVTYINASILCSDDDSSIILVTGRFLRNKKFRLINYNKNIFNTASNEENNIRFKFDYNMFVK